MTVSDEVLWARSDLLHLTYQPTRAISSFVREHGPVDAVAAMLNGSAPPAVLGVMRKEMRGGCTCLFEAPEARLIVPESEEWPREAFSVLRDSEPYGLWVRGSASLAALSRRAVALVGTREKSTYGRAVVREFADAFAMQGVTVVAGGSWEIETTALQAAVKADGQAVAVLATPDEETFPLDRASLMHEITERGGLVIAESPTHTPTSRRRVGAARRIIAALASTAVIVEARRNDALDASRLAELYGRRLYAVPGPINALQSLGSNELLRSGHAAMALSAWEVSVDDLVIDR